MVPKKVSDAFKKSPKLEKYSIVGGKDYSRKDVKSKALEGKKKTDNVMDRARKINKDSQHTHKLYNKQESERHEKKEGNQYFKA